MEKEKLRERRRKEVEEVYADGPEQLYPGALVYFRFSEKIIYPAFIQGYESDGSARLWVASEMSWYRTTCTEGIGVGFWSRDYRYLGPTTFPPEY